MSSANSRGRIWIEALAGKQKQPSWMPGSVIVSDSELNGEPARFLAVVPNPDSRFPRVRNGEVGLEEGWSLARAVREVVDADRNGTKRPIIAVVDVKSQAYGRREELAGIHLACASAVDAYATARMAGHPVIALVVGPAISGAFLSHGYQANRILAFNSPEVMVHAMGKAAAARITKRSISELEKLAEEVVPMAYDIRSYAKLGTLHKLLEIENPDNPQKESVELVRQELIEAIADTRKGPRDLSNRLDSEGAKRFRHASIEARQKLIEQWTAV